MRLAASTVRQELQLDRPAIILHSSHVIIKGVSFAEEPVQNRTDVDWVEREPAVEFFLQVAPTTIHIVYKRSAKKHHVKMDLGVDQVSAV